MRGLSLGIQIPIRFALSVMVSIFFVVTSSPGWAQNVFVKVVTGSNYHPYTDENLKHGGLATAMVMMVFREMGFDATVDFMPWDEGYDQAAAGKYLATFPYIKKKEREADFVYSDELFRVRTHVFQHIDKPAIKKREHIQDMDLCVPDGWAVDAYLQDLIDTGALRLVRGTSMDDCFDRLHKQKVSIISVDRRLGQVLAEQQDRSKWFVSRRLSSGAGTPNHVLFTRKHPQAIKWARAFNSKLRELHENGKIAELIASYYKR